ncbi:hypothetical protein C8R47DRAFT_1095334 [Mycena vitilis]|nr:hypothetical protein C8R47DRAFT_1095334 [Mycena vitilis]
MPHKSSYGVQDDTRLDGLKATHGPSETVSVSEESDMLKSDGVSIGLATLGATFSSCYPTYYDLGRFPVALPYPPGYVLSPPQYSSPSAHHVESDDVSGNRSQWIPIPFVSTTNACIRTLFWAQGAGHIRVRREIGLDILRRACSFNPLPSAPSTCHSDTRRDALEVLYRWATDSASTCRILCVHGPLGVGKSAIFGTLAERLHAAHRLGASFVFHRSLSPQKNARAIFCIIAYQLAINIPPLRALISRAVRKNPGIVGEAMDVQLQELILQPCRGVMFPNPLIMMIDGLDEFADDVQREILCLLGNAVEIQPCSLRILIATRFGNNVSEILTQSCTGLWRSLSIERSRKGVRSYLLAELGQIRENSPDFSAMVPWFSTQVLDALVEASSGCFLYASTLVNFLGDTNFSPTKRLAAVASLPYNHLNSSLDNLYIHILASVPTESHSHLLALLHILATKNFADLPLFHIEQLLHMKSGRLRRLLRRVSSVLNVPPLDDGVIAVQHSSFLEFLVDPARSGAFCVSSAAHSMYLVRCILKSLAYVHQNPRVNRAGHVAWNHLAALVEYVTSTSPSADLLPLVEGTNPDFFFGTLSAFENEGPKILSWLKQMHPRPSQTIQVWEDYSYMAFFHSTVNDFDFDEEPDMFSASELRAEGEILLRHPQLIRFRVLLNVSWEDLRTIVCALRPVFGRNDAALIQLWRSLQDPTFARAIAPWSTVFRDLAHQSIRMMRAAYIGTIPMEVVGYWLEWGRYVRSCPPSDELLHELTGFVPRDDSQYNIATESEIYDVLRWLESFPGVPQDEWSRWAKFLPAETELEREYAYEARWTSWRALEWYDV